MQPELQPGESFEQLFKGSETAGQCHHPIGQFAHACFALMHRVHQLEL
ncbi:MAG: Uncharacterised protein [Synechococcus sp. CC9902]|nr:MAG: Uncharacterised protein [Synechococcus sp. CC9902]